MEFDADTDEELALYVQKGDAKAFATLVHRHTDYLYRIVWRTCPDSQEAEDIVQDIFLKFWKQPKSYDVSRGAKFRTWITRVAINRAIDVVRKKHPTPDYDLLLKQGIDKKDAPLEELEAKVASIELEQAIQNLPDRQKEAVNLCFYEDFSRKDAALIMDVSVKALESLLMRAKKTLFGILSERNIF